MVPKTKTFLFLLCLISVAIFPLWNDLTTNVGAGGDGVIDGNTVYIDDENVYLGATPHTLNRDGWVLFELETKTWDGDIDVIWGFDTPSCTPRQGQIWVNYSHELTGYDWFDRVGNLIFYDVISYIDLGIENYSSYDVVFGNENNTYLYNFTYNAGANWTIAAFTSYEEIGDGDDYRLTGHYDRWESYVYYETYFDWKPWEVEWDVINYEYGGMNKWWLLENASIVHNYRYRVRAWIDIPEWTDGKYWWAMKPHDVTLEQSIIDGTFYCLDPWWESVYYNESIVCEINHSLIDANLTNFPVVVVLNSTIASGCRANGEDICFFQGAITLNYEIELWNASGDSYVWVNVSTIDASSNSVFYMYYGNATVADGQNKHGVWDSNFLGVYHMAEASGSITDSTFNTRTGTTSGSLNYQRPGMVGYAIDFPRVAGDHFLLPNNMSSGVDMDVTVEGYCALVPDTFGAPYFSLAGLRYSHCFWLRYKRADDSMQCAYGLPPSDWIILDVEQPHTNDSIIKQYVGTYDNDGSAVGYFQGENTTFSTTTGNVLARVDGNYIGNDEGINNRFKGLIDEVRFSDIPRSAAWINASFHSFNQTTGFLTTYYTPNYEMVIHSESPANESTNVSRKLGWLNASAYKPEGMGVGIHLKIQTWEAFSDTNWTSTGNATNVSLDLSSVDPLSYSTNYTWYVNATDYPSGPYSTNATFWFVTGPNSAPVVTLSDPANETVNTSRHPMKFWNATDPNGDDILYDVYFGTAEDPPKITSNQSNNYFGEECSPGCCHYNITYYWRIVAWDEAGLDNTSEIWSYTSKLNIPPVVTLSSPTNESTNITQTPTLYWNATDPDSPPPIAEYDVYFGTAANPPKVVTNQSANNYIIPTMLDVNTTYYWRVEVWDGCGLNGTSEIWSFTTPIPWMNVTIKNYYNDTLCNYNWSTDVTIPSAVFNANKLNTSKWYLTIVTDGNLDKTIRVNDSDGEVYNLSGWGLDDKTLIYDIFLHMASYYGSLYINYSTLTHNFTARINLQYNVSYPLSASYSNYSTFGGANYAKAPILNLTYYYGRFNESGSNRLRRAVELIHEELGYADYSYLRHSSPGIYNSTDSIDPTRATIDNGALVNFTSVGLSPDDRPTYENFFVTNFEFYFDNEAPEYSEAIVSVDIGIDSTGRCNITLYNVTDVTPENITVNLSVNGGAYYCENSSVYNNTNVTFLNIPLQDGINYFNYTLYDEWNTTCYYNLTYTIYLYNFVCVDEESGDYIDVSAFFDLIATIPERLWSVDLKANGNGNFTYLSDLIDLSDPYSNLTHPHTIRLEIIYTEVDDGGNHVIITRYYDCTLLPSANITRIAVPYYQPLFEQLLYSAREKPFSIYNMEAEAWICVDYTRMAYAQAMAQYAYTINALYWLRTYNSDGTQNILVTMDGGKPTAINLDMLEYQNTTYDFTLLADGLGIKRLTNSTLQIYYFNPANDNTKVYLRLFNATQTFLHWNETVVPNEFMIFFNFSSYDLNETDVLTINITMTKTTGMMAYIQESFTLQATGVAEILLTAAIAAITAIILAVFGLTLFSVRNTFAFFGPIICGMGIAITLLAEQIWYITLVQIVLTILIIVQFMIYKDEYAGAIR